jgi:glycosyltransferase involved in cell wall biosynthesis
VEVTELESVEGQVDRARDDLTVTPVVSVVIPTYDSRELLTEALDALAIQSMPPTAIEVIVVDDGSTDGTWEMLCERQQTHPNLRILRQSNSGRPSVGRNRGLEQATGRYVFFNDADDYLAPDALRRLVTFGDEAGSDVVVGRVRRIGKAQVVRPFRGTVKDADLIADRVWMSLGPMKLFRRDLIERLGLRFPEDVVQGEDQVFVASCLFAAKRVSVLDDYDYYYRRTRADNRNISNRLQTLANKLLTTTRMTRLIVSNTTPDARRDFYMRRVLIKTLEPALYQSFQQADADEQRQFLATVQEEVMPHLTEGLLAYASAPCRMRLLVARNGTIEELREANEVLRKELRYCVQEGALAYDLGPRLNGLVASQARAVHPLPKLENRIITAKRVPSGYRLTAEVNLTGLPVDSVELVGTWREGDGLIILDAAPPSNGHVSLRIRSIQLRHRRCAVSSGHRELKLALRAQFDHVTVATSRVSSCDPAALPTRGPTGGRAAQRDQKLVGNTLQNSVQGLTLIVAGPDHRVQRIRRGATRKVKRVVRQLLDRREI